MNRTHCQYRRMLKVLNLIRHGRLPDDCVDSRRLQRMAHNCTTIANELRTEWEACSTKTVQRDIDFLRDDMGAPIEYCQQRKGYYLTDEAFTVPGGIIPQKELTVLCMIEKIMQIAGIPAGLFSASLDKLGANACQALAELRKKVDTCVSIKTPAAKFPENMIWETIVTALMGNTSLFLKYKPAEGRSGKVFCFYPYRLFFKEGQLWISGLCPESHTVQEIALTELVSASPGNHKFAVPEGYDRIRKPGPLPVQDIPSRLRVVSAEEEPRAIA